MQKKTKNLKNQDPKNLKPKETNTLKNQDP